MQVIIVNGSIPSWGAHMLGVHAVQLCVAEGCRRAVKEPGKLFTVNLCLDNTNQQCSLAYKSPYVTCSSLPDLVGRARVHSYEVIFARTICLRKSVAQLSPNESLVVSL